MWGGNLGWESCSSSSDTDFDDPEEQEGGGEGKDWEGCENMDCGG